MSDNVTPLPMTEEVAAHKAQTEDLAKHLWRALYGWTEAHTPAGQEVCLDPDHMLNAMWMLLSQFTDGWTPEAKVQFIASLATGLTANLLMGDAEKGGKH